MEPKEMSHQLRHYYRNRERMLKRQAMCRKWRIEGWEPDRTRGQPKRTKPKRVPVPRALYPDDVQVINYLASIGKTRVYAFEIADATGMEQARVEQVLLRLYALKAVNAYCHCKGHRPFTWSARFNGLADLGLESLPDVAQHDPP